MGSHLCKNLLLAFCINILNIISEVCRFFCPFLNTEAKSATTNVVILPKYVRNGHKAVAH